MKKENKLGNWLLILLGFELVLMLFLLVLCTRNYFRTNFVFGVGFICIPCLIRFASYVDYFDFFWSRNYLPCRWDCLYSRLSGPDSAL